MTVLPVTDLDSCAAEPIRIPGGIQPHGALLVLDPQTLVLRQASANAGDVLGRPAVPGSVFALDASLAEWVQGGSATLLQSYAAPGGAFQVSGHRTPQGTILEFEPVGDGGEQSLESLFPTLQQFADTITGRDGYRAVGEAIAEQIRAITGFNRVMLYRFDPEWNGTVLAESSDGVLPTYLDLRFPASDIPAQARELYRLNPLRIIPDANYRPVPLVPVMSPEDGQPLDLSFAGLRSVSPIHLQYMRNMGTYASMSVSVLVEDRLWGLISCHSQAPQRVSPAVRAACNFVAKVASLQISSLERGAHAAQRIALKQRETGLVARLSQSRSLTATLAQHAAEWLSLTNAAGAAVITDTGFETVGEVPPPSRIRELADWLARRQGGDVFATDHLTSVWDEGEDIADAASGVIAVTISQLHPSFVLWFRPEVVRTVTWGGDPRKPAELKEQLTPRSSFAQWRELVRNRAEPWTRAEIESAGDFRNALINFVLRRAEERAQATEELERTNKELESFSYSVSHDLRAPFRHIVGYAELLTEREKSLDDKSRHYLRSIVEAALSAGRLVDDLLNFSQLGRTALGKSRVDMNKIVAEVIKTIQPDVGDRQVEWQVGNLPPAWGDAALLRQAIANLVENAVKYTGGREPAVIEITGDRDGGMSTYRVKDNGVGFEMAYVDKLFGVFQRLHRAEDFAGTGIGLALTKRIIERHGGKVKAEGEVNKGATFSFTLPQRTNEEGGSA